MLRSVIARYPATIPKNVAVVLSGCGVYDGTEVQEAVSVLVALSRAKANVQCFAPEGDQFHVINHRSGAESENAKRNILEEASRISRGNIKPLNELSSKDFSALIVPGGFGAAKNLSDFAVKGKDFSVKQEVSDVLNDFRKNNKPIGLCCISPVVAAKVFPGCKVTIGNDKDTAHVIEGLGCQHEVKSVTEVCIDNNKQIVTTPAYMYGEAPVHEVFDGIQKMVEETLNLCKE